MLPSSFWQLEGSRTRSQRLQEPCRRVQITAAGFAEFDDMQIRDVTSARAASRPWRYTYVLPARFAYFQACLGPNGYAPPRICFRTDLDGTLSARCGEVLNATRSAVLISPKADGSAGWQARGACGGVSAVGQRDRTPTESQKCRVTPVRLRTAIHRKEKPLQSRGAR